jgi:hypothetical protein
VVKQTTGNASVVAFNKDDILRHQYGRNKIVRKQTELNVWLGIRDTWSHFGYSVGYSLALKMASIRFEKKEVKLFG